MTEYASKNQEQGMFSLGMAFKGFLIGAVAIGGIWVITVLLQMFLKGMG
jgi:hypothetical protein